MSDSDFPDGPGQSALTREIVLRYHLGWKRCDLEAVLALHVEYHDFFLNRSHAPGRLHGRPDALVRCLAIIIAQAAATGLCRVRRAHRQTGCLVRAA